MGRAHLNQDECYQIQYLYGGGSPAGKTMLTYRMSASRDL